MKTVELIALIAFSGLIGCGRRESTDPINPLSPSIVKEASDKVSASALLERFKSSDFSAFFGMGNATFENGERGGGILRDQPGYVKGGTFHNKCRYIKLYIYESERAAMAAVEWRRKNVAAIIKKSSKVRNGITHWWFSESQALLSIVQGSMVFEVSVLDRTYSAVEDELWSVAKKFLNIAEPSVPVK